MVYFIIMENTENTVVVQTLNLKNEFCDKEGIHALHIYIDGKKKKKYKTTKDKKYRNFVHGVEKGWMNWDKQKIDKYNNQNKKATGLERNSHNIKLKGTKYMVLDIDYDQNLTPEENDTRRDKYLEEYGNFNITYSVGSKYPHLYRIAHPDDVHTDWTNFKPGLDLRYTNVFEHDDAFMHNINLDLVFDSGRRGQETNNKKQKKIKLKTKKIIKSSNNKIDELVSNEEKEIIDNIDVKYIDNYGDWLKLTWGLYNHFESVEVCDYLSQRGSNYGGVNIIKEKILSDNRSNVSWGTICWYSRQSDENNFMDIRARYVIDLKPSEESLSTAFIKLVDGNILFSDDKVFIFDKEWKWDEKKYRLKKQIRVLLNALVKRKINQINDEDDDAPIKNKYLSEILLKVQQRKTIDNVAEFTIQTLADDEDIKKIEFDVNQEQLYNIHFKNGCYELKTKTFRKRTKMDYVTKYLDWEYKENVDQKYIDEVNSFFNKLHVNEEERFFCISWLASCLDGSLNKNMFKLNIGESAENGKSTEFNIHERVFDIYSDKIQSNFFNHDNNKRHKEIIGLMKNPIRFGYMEEMKTTKLDADVLKEMSEGNMKCEILYGTTITAKVQVTLNGCFNRMINIPLDAGIMRRAVLQSYNSSFPKDYNGEDDYKNKTFKPDKFFVNKFDDENMKNAYLHVLLNHYKVSIDVPQRYSENFADMAKEFDEFDNALDNIIEKTNNQFDRIQKDVFVESMWNAGCGTKNWRNILSNMKSRKYVYERQARCDGKKGCFVGIRFKNND